MEKIRLEKEEIKEKLNKKTESLLKEYINALVDVYGVDFIENKKEFPEVFFLFLLDEVDEGESGTYINEIGLMDDMHNLIELDFEVVGYSSWKKEAIETKFILILEELITEYFDLEELKYLFGHEIKIKLK